MNIKELDYERPIKISKFDFSCDDIDKSIPKPLPQSQNFFKLIIGRPGSGKTNLILNLLCKRHKNYNGKFDKVFIWSPSLGTMKNSPFASIPDDQMYDELTVENLEGVLDIVRDSSEKCLFLWDDCVNDIRKSPELQRLINKIVMNRRHLAGAGGSVAVIMTSQVYNKIQASIRKTASHVYLFHTRNKAEINTIFDELILISKKEFYNILNFVFKKRHDFLYVDINAPLNKMFHKGFKLLNFKMDGDDELNV